MLDGSPVNPVVWPVVQRKDAEYICCFTYVLIRD